jgi:RsiW-degrading membrane proteinase PrsW (M82 family)
MLHLLFALGLSALPAFLLLRYFYRRDLERPEPLRLVGKSFLYGFLAVAPAAVIESVLLYFFAPADGLGGNLIQAFLIAATVEESTKLFFVRHYLFRRAEFDERADGIIYAICVSLGFAFVENFLYGYRDTRVLLLRGITAVPLHAVATGVMGYYLGRARIDGLRDGKRHAAQAWKRGLVWAVAIHGGYDFFLLTGGLASLLVVPLLLCGWSLLKRLFRKAQVLDAADEFLSPFQKPPQSLP